MLSEKKMTVPQNFQLHMTRYKVEMNNGIFIYREEAVYRFNYYSPDEQYKIGSSEEWFNEPNKLIM